ncbi:Myelin transcription factor 1-like protein [Actinidia chinensis var. chinensis]|uniref:Myelin transcription factor 1-like protein n=1 Tax=Actinidia chinensis var. chinensis TaxID=1590841 RepID=A0A2R6PDS6_ACTCC|nr:Myelin transcription factor 1-like protein [Actinidia chinensis var. chinensis]
MSSQIQMTGSKTSAATTCLFSLLISLYILVSFTDRSTSWSILNASVFPITGAFLLAALVVVAARATVVVWITVLVLLAFSGKRRRVLAAQGRKITAEVAMYLVKVLLKEKGVAAVACATILSFMAMSCFTNV